MRHELIQITSNYENLFPADVFIFICNK